MLLSRSATVERFTEQFETPPSIRLLLCIKTLIVRSHFEDHHYDESVAYAADGGTFLEVLTKLTEEAWGQQSQDAYAAQAERGDPGEWP